MAVDALPPLSRPPGILAYTEYGALGVMKAVAWVAGLIVSLLIIASRKHYTVDVVSEAESGKHLLIGVLQSCLSRACWASHFRT